MLLFSLLCTAVLKGTTQLHEKHKIKACIRE
ncbi:MAG: hypothetical protein ACI87N_003245 [Flavobacteriales bacterium]